MHQSQADSIIWFIVWQQILGALLNSVQLFCDFCYYCVEELHEHISIHAIIKAVLKQMMHCCRESCCPYEGNYVKDLQCLGRDLSTTIIVDNSPHSYVFQPENAVPIGTFIDDMDDQELLEITPILMGVEQVDDVREHLSHHIAQAHAHALRSRTRS